ncbi:MAG: MarR family transcriptional regulator [Ignavibacteria bacterium]|nr:MarR family transcriptional regulator [Ignavibacteria bacterium]
MKTLNLDEKIKREIIQSFGEAYKAFGLSKLMGHIVALMIFSHQPLSLDEICKQLRRSKGPVSQIVRRLRDRNLIKKVWVPGSRKDFYEAHPDIFENAFRNNFELIKKNKKLATELKSKAKKSDHEAIGEIIKRLDEMEEFYTLMVQNYQKFLDDWSKLKLKYR